MENDVKYITKEEYRNERLVEIQYQKDLDAMEIRLVENGLVDLIIADITAAIKVAYEKWTPDSEEMLLTASVKDVIPLKPPENCTPSLYAEVIWRRARKYFIDAGFEVRYNPDMDVTKMINLDNGVYTFSEDNFDVSIVL